jgi:hypothetical protein
VFVAYIQIFGHPVASHPHLGKAIASWKIPTRIVFDD